MERLGSNQPALGVGRKRGGQALTMASRGHALPELSMQRQPRAVPAGHGGHGSGRRGERRVGEGRGKGSEGEWMKE